MSERILKAALRLACGTRSHRMLPLDIENVKRQLPPNTMPAWYEELLIKTPVADTGFAYKTSSRIYHMLWMSCDTMLRELAGIPACVAIRYGYLPFAECHTGSGDPYFLEILRETEDPPVVQIYHDMHLYIPAPKSMRRICNHLSTLLEGSVLEC